ncbi:MAG: hypothetical protein AB1716_21645 [Planctomycetota bacterium]
MPPKWPQKWNPPKYWRLRATATDGLVVTLGRYATEAEAHLDLGRFTHEGGYRDLSIQPITPRPEPDVV